MGTDRRFSYRPSLSIAVLPLPTLEPRPHPSGTHDRVSSGQAAHDGRQAHAESGACSDAARRLLVDLSSRMTPQLDTMADTMVAEYAREIDTYAGVRDSTEVYREVWEITRMHLGMLFPVVVGEKPALEPRDVASLRMLGVRRAEQGFSLHTVLRAYQVGTKVAWEMMLAELTDLAGASPLVLATSGALGTAILASTAQASEEVSRAYMEAKGRAATSGERARRALFEELLRGGGSDDASLRRRARGLGYRLGSAHLVVAAGSVDPLPTADPVRAVAHRRMMDALDALRPTGAPPLVDTDADLVIAVVIVDPGSSMAHVVHEVRRRLSAVDVNVDVPFVAGVADPVLELSQVAMSYRQACRTVEIVRAVGEPGAVATYAEMLPYLVVAQDRELAADLVGHSVGPLLGLGLDAHPDGRAALTETLRTYLAERGRLGRTADHMQVHRHTVSSRLARIETITGIDLDDPAGLMRLQLGLHAAAVMAGAPMDHQSTWSWQKSTGGP